MDEFKIDIRNAVTREIVKARRDPVRGAAMVETLAHAVGFTVAYLTKGDAVKSQELLTGVEGYIYESATSHSQMAKLILPLLDKPE